MIRSLLWFLELDDTGLVEFACATGDYSNAFGLSKRDGQLLLAAVNARWPGRWNDFAMTVESYLERLRAQRSRRRTTSPDPSEEDAA